jgi:hypothetical protein
MSSNRKSKCSFPFLFFFVFLFSLWGLLVSRSLLGMVELAAVWLSFPITAYFVTETQHVG